MFSLWFMIPLTIEASLLPLLLLCLSCNCYLLLPLLFPDLRPLTPDLCLTLVRLIHINQR